MSSTCLHAPGILVILFLWFGILFCSAELSTRNDVAYVNVNDANGGGCYLLIHTHKDAVKGIGSAFESLCGWKECECKVSKTSFHCTKGQDIRSLWGPSWERLCPFPSGALVNHFHNSNVNYAWKVPFAKRLRALQAAIGEASCGEIEENCLQMRMPDSFFPRTFVPEEPTDLASLLRSLPSRAKLPSEDGQIRSIVNPSGMEVPFETAITAWIMKPTDGSGGFGTHLVTSSKELMDVLDSHRRTQFVVQEYISNPLLVEGRKLDFRAFVLLTSASPLRAHMYLGDFPIRVCTKEFGMSGLDLVKDDIMVHISNPQRHDGGGIVWSPHDFDAYFGNGTFEERILPEMADIVTSALLAYPKGSNVKNAFELLAFDLLFDENMRGWLMEGNTNPSLNLVSAPRKNHTQIAYDTVCKGLMDINTSQILDGRKLQCDEKQWQPIVFPSDSGRIQKLVDDFMWKMFPPRVTPSPERKSSISKRELRIGRVSRND